MQKANVTIDETIIKYFMAQTCEIKQIFHFDKEIKL